MLPQIYLKSVFIYDFLCSVPIEKSHETVFTLKNGIWGNLKLRSWSCSLYSKLFLISFEVGAVIFLLC